MKIDWMRKLTSRKLWLAVATFVSMLIIYFTGDADKAEKVSALIIAGGAVVAYILAEGWADGNHLTDSKE